MTHPAFTTSTTPGPTLDGHPSWTETRTWGTGLVQTRRVVADPWEEHWENCFCCTCDVEGPDGIPRHGMSDPGCRLHGFAGKRPCDEHHTPGTPWDDTDVMPMPVNEYRKAVANGESTY